MNEQNVGNLDVEAILANEELMKKLAAKVLDIIQQKPDAGVVCQGYYCNMAKGDQPEEWKSLCKRKLDSLDMELEDGLAAALAEDYPLSAEELDQVVTEIKTSESYAGKLSRADMSRAVSKVLADNEMMRRKGSAESIKTDPGTSYFCVPGAPNNLYPKPKCYPWIAPIVPCYSCSPNKLSLPGIPDNPRCYPCSPLTPGHFPGSPNEKICPPCGPFFGSLHASIPSCRIYDDIGGCRAYSDIPYPPESVTELEKLEAIKKILAQ